MTGSLLKLLVTGINLLRPKKQTSDEWVTIIVTSTHGNDKLLIFLGDFCSFLWVVGVHGPSHEGEQHLPLQSHPQI